MTKMLLESNRKESYDENVYCSRIVWHGWHGYSTRARMARGHG